jgi:hypothetical protein
MTQDEIIEMAIQGHASTRDAIRWAMNQEREKVFDMLHEMHVKANGQHNYYLHATVHIRARGKA